MGPRFGVFMNMDVVGQTRRGGSRTGGRTIARTAPKKMGGWLSVDLRGREGRI